MSVTPEIIDLETTKIIPTVAFKYNANATTKTQEALAALITTAITNFSSTDLEVFDTVFRYSPFVTLIDDVDPAILSNITNIKISKTFKPTLGTALKYTITFSNALFIIHILAMQPGQQERQLGGILSSTGFTETGKTPTYYLEDDGAGLVNAYYISGASKVYQDRFCGYY